MKKTGPGIKISPPSRPQLTVQRKGITPSTAPEIECPNEAFLRREGAPCDRKMVGSVLDDILHMMHTPQNEHPAFNTQKPENLLQRIIPVSSRPGDIVADFFCGSGTTLAVTEKLGRRWIGSHLSKLAIQVTRKRLLDIHHSKDLMEDNKE